MGGFELLLDDVVNSVSDVDSLSPYVQHEDRDCGLKVGGDLCTRLWALIWGFMDS